jgi:hypothetical protein
MPPLSACVRTVRVVVAWAIAGVLAGTSARAAAPAPPSRLVLATHDPALASALSVAVSPRGLSVVERPDPLTRTSDQDEARRELAVQDAVAVVWLCDDDAGAHALCFHGRDGRFVARPVTVAAPLAAPDAAALALTVKVLLGPPAPPPAPPRETAPPSAASPPAPAAPVESRPVFALPKVTAELVGGVRLQGAAPHAGARFGFTAVFAPDRLERRLGLGLGLTAGPRQAVSDVALRALARGRVRLQPAWLDLDLGPTAHFLSVDVGAQTARGTQLSLDALAGVIVPLGPYFAGLRAGVTFVPAPDAAPSLPRWSGEAQLVFGANVL